MPALHSKTWSVAHLGAALIVAVVVLGVGLDRYGMWQPGELHMADEARDGGDSVQRPPLQVAMLRYGFRHFGPTERGGRLPTALYAIFATLFLSIAVARCSDARTGAFAGIAYATLPLVFLNARQMFGGGVSQSGFTIVFAAMLMLVWARPPPEGWPRTAWNLGKWVLLGSVWFGVVSAGWMLGVIPVLLGVAIAIGLRARREPWLTRGIAVVFGSAAAALLVIALRVVMRHVAAIAAGNSAEMLHAYNPWLGVGGDARAPGQFPTFDALIEQIGLASFPWTGFALLGSFRLLSPPSQTAGVVGGAGGSLEDSGDDREQGARLGAFMVMLVAFAVQTFHLQNFGVSPFIAAAPLAVGCAVLLRDAEREASPWRMVTAAGLFGLVIIARDYVLFPKSSYAGLGLPDGGPIFPQGFSGKYADWFRAHPGVHIVTDFFAGKGIAEMHFLFWSVIFGVIALPAMFQGAGPISTVSFGRPYRLLIEIQARAERQMMREEESLPRWKPLRHFTALGVFANLGIVLAAIPVVAVMAIDAFIVFGMTPARLAQLAPGWGARFIPPTLSGKLRLVLIGAPATGVEICIGVLVAIYVGVALWNAFAVAGRPDASWTRIFGSRIAFVPLAAVVTSLFVTQMFVPALSEHFSPRGVWAVIRQHRNEGEPVARYGGVPSDRATRYYANFDVHDLATEQDAIDWLNQTNPRHFLVIGGESFAPLNRAYRASFPEGQRRNIPVLDVSSANLYVAVSRLSATSQNPLDAIVMSADTMLSTTDHWHEHGHRVDGRFVREPARFDDAIEYLGFNLDSGGQSFVPVGGSFRITYHFHVLQQISGDYQLFVHFEGACERQVLDHVPGGGRLPVRYWLPGDYIHDEQRITIPSTCRGGRYTLQIGFFQGQRRMAVTGGEHDAENRVVAAAINVR